MQLLSHRERFSPLLPTLQTRVNSSSLGPFKQCPRKYQYSILWGLRSKGPLSIDLTFGTLIHRGIELYDRLRLAGIEHEPALLDVVAWGLRETWNFTLRRPMTFDHTMKNREGLIRTLVLYLDKYGENDPLTTYILTNGTPGLELSFEFDSGYRASTGERISFIGRLDKLVEFNQGVYIKDVKTTKSGLGSRYFERYSPDNQFSLYPLGGRIAFGIPIKGIIADAVQVGVSFSAFERAMVPRSEESLQEWLEDAQWWLGLMDECARRDYWPQNDKSCGLYGGCEFREICAMGPGSRATWLERNFVVRGDDE